MNIKFIFLFSLVFFLSLSLLSALPTTIDSKTITDKGLTLEVQTAEAVQWEKVDNSYTPVYKDDSKYIIITDKVTKQIINKTLKPLDNITFFVNKIDDITCVDAFFFKTCSGYKWDFSKFESKNRIERKEIMAVYSDEKQVWYLQLWEDIVKFFGGEVPKGARLIGYNINYYGIITDLDPSLVLVYTASNNDMLNATAVEGSSLGARLSASVLFMDFNTAPEINQDGTQTYVKDNSVYNNAGTLN